MSDLFLSSSDSKNEIIKKSIEFTGRKSYFLIDYKGNIKKKSINLFLPLIAATEKENSEKVLKIIEQNYIWKEERKKVKKPDRLTKLSIEELKKNMFKTIQNSESVFALKFANELYLRDRESFKNIVLFSACINREDNILPLMALSALKLMENSEIEYFYPLYIIVELLSLYPKNYKEYERAYFGKNSCKGRRDSTIEGISINIQNRAFIKSVEILKNSTIEGIKILQKISEELEKSETDEKIKISEIEEIIFKIIQ